MVKTPAAVSGRKRIALLIDTATSWGSGLIEGVCEFAKENGREWIFSFEPRGKYDRMMLPKTWKGDGVVARITHSELAEALISSHTPAINVSWFRFGQNLIPRCTCDEVAAAEMAGQYFLDSGFRQFAYCGSTLRPSYHDRLGAAFVEYLQERGHRCETFTPDKDRIAELDSEQQLELLSDWLGSLPRPVALLTFDDIQARQVTEACTQSGIMVPSDVAVLGGEHDDLCSRVSCPQLSGIDQAPVDVGYHAALMLDQLMAGESLKSSTVMLPPRRIITRQSTDQLAVKDDMLARAIQYIRENYARDLQIRDILQAVPLSRRALEMGFKAHLGRTPREEIRRVRVQKALELLCDTDLSVTRVAGVCGFDRPELLTRAFRRELNSTPSEFRRRVSQPRSKSGAC